MAAYRSSCDCSTKMSLALDVQRDFRLLPSLLFLQFLHRQQHVDIDHLIEVPRHPFQFGEHVLAQRGRHFKVMSADRQVHRSLLSQGGGRSAGRACGPRPSAAVRWSTRCDPVCAANAGADKRRDAIRSSQAGAAPHAPGWRCNARCHNCALDPSKRHLGPESPSVTVHSGSGHGRRIRGETVRPSHPATPGADMSRRARWSSPMLNVFTLANGRLDSGRDRQRARADRRRAGVGRHGGAHTAGERLDRAALRPDDSRQTSSTTTWRNRPASTKRTTASCTSARTS